MGFKDMIRGEFVDIIEWLDNTNTTLAWRFPRYDMVSMARRSV